jgi:succinoglycan biosynthesis transport protein ExoP
MWHAVYKKLWIVILAPLLAAGVAYLLTAKKAGQYRSTAVVEASIPDAPAKSQTLKDIPEPDEYYDNMVATMKTEVITSMVSYRLLLHDLETEIAFRPPAIQYTAEKKAAIRKTLEKKLSSFELLSENVPAESTIGQVIHNMDYNIARWVRDGDMMVSRKDNSNEINVATITEDPFLSAFASNSLAQEYIRYETAIATPPPANNDSVGYYRQEVERLRKNLEAKNGELNEANARIKTSSPADDIRFQRARSNRVSEYEMKIKEEEWELSSLREQLSRVQREPAPQQRSSKDIRTSSKIQAIRNKIDQLSGIYAQGGSKDKKLDSVINVLRKQLNDETTRLQMASQATTSASSGNDRERDMLESRIRRHEENIAAIRSDIRRLKNTSNKSVNDNQKAIAQLKSEQQQANDDYNAALVHLRTLEKKAGIPDGPASRESHHLVLKEKALPSAEPESPYATLIVLLVFAGTLVLCIVIIAATRPAPAPYDDIFLRVNYSNRDTKKKSASVAEGG